MAPLAILTDMTLVASLPHRDCIQHEGQAAFPGPTSSCECPYSASSIAMHRLSLSPKVLYLRRTTLSDAEPGPLHLLHRRASGVSMLGLTIGLSFAFVILGIVVWLLGKKSSGRKKKGSKKRSKKHRIHHQCTYEDTSTHDHHDGTRHQRSHNSVRQDWTFPYPEMAIKDHGIWPSCPEPVYPAQEAPVLANDMDAPQDDTRDEPAYNGRYWMRW
ncbi:hypothetical protein B0J13DRAFT_622915 [Dactylonectria estremocensis]|uniref:Uncharacterized protein n=1 Tax=Dactylonectria estremocensis TaxID=1079267 RepID=A0A9P9EUY8_9HYPO|nr:hypothetical protein B0J13DRAFT_622915 [Dactylonectria estremocensis]